MDTQTQFKSWTQHLVLNTDPEQVVTTKIKACSYANVPVTADSWFLYAVINWAMIQENVISLKKNNGRLLDWGLDAETCSFLKLFQVIYVKRSQNFSFYCFLFIRKDWSFYHILKRVWNNLNHFDF